MRILYSPLERSYLKYKRSDSALKPNRDVLMCFTEFSNLPPSVTIFSRVIERTSNTVIQYSTLNFDHDLEPWSNICNSDLDLEH